MKSTSWKKEWLVIAHSDYDNTWSALTIPCTFKQASAFINNARYASRYERGLIRFVTVSEFASMQVICPPFPPATGAVPWTPKQIREYDLQQRNQLPQALL